MRNKIVAFVLVFFIGSALVVNQEGAVEQRNETVQIQNEQAKQNIKAEVKLVSSAGLFCIVGICGHGRNHYKSVRNIAFKCANGEWWWVRPGNEDPCKDAVKAKVPTTGNTWRIYPKTHAGPGGRVLQKKGSYIGISDGETVRLRSYS